MLNPLFLLSKGSMSKTFKISLCLTDVRTKIHVLWKKNLFCCTCAKEYEDVRSESRKGVQLTEEEASRLDALISPLIKNGQSLHHICVNHMDELMINERTLYNYVNAGLFTARNIDMPRVVRMGNVKGQKRI